MKNKNFFNQNFNNYLKIILYFLNEISFQYNKIAKKTDLRYYSQETYNN